MFWFTGLFRSLHMGLLQGSTRWRVAEYVSPKYVALEYRLFWAISTWKIINAEWCFVWSPLICLKTDSPKGNSIVINPLPRTFAHQGKRSTPHPDIIFHKMPLIYSKAPFIFLKIIYSPLGGLHFPYFYLIWYLILNSNATPLNYSFFLGHPPWFTD